MNAALSSRFITIDIPYMSQSSEQKFLKERFPKADSTVVGRFVAFADKSRKAYKKDFLSVPVTPRNLMQWLDAMEKGQFTIDDIEPMVLGVFPPDQQNQVKGLLEGKKIDEVFKSIVGD